MKLFKFTLLLLLFLFYQQILAQNFQPKFVETELSSMFFDTTKYKIPETLMNPDIISLSPFNVEDSKNEIIPNDWMAFKKAFLALEIPKEYEYIYRNLSFMNQWLNKDKGNNFYTKTPGFNPFHPIQSCYNIFSKEHKELRKYYALMQKDYIDDIVGEKCPIEIVKMITGEISDSTVYAFFNYCNFNQKEVEEATSYDIVVLIKDKWSSFVGKHEEDSIITPTHTNN